MRTTKFYAFILCSFLALQGHRADAVDQALPPEVSRALGNVAELIKQSDHYAYEAEYAIEGYREMTLPQGIDGPPKPSPEFKEIARSAGAIQFRRDGDRQLVVVTPKVVNPKHRSMSFGARAMYGQEKEIVRNFSERDMMLRIDRVGGMQGLLARPHDLPSIESLFGSYFSADWLSRITDTSAKNVETALKTNPLETKVTRDPPDAKIGATSITIEDSITIPHLRTVFGVVHGSRTVTYARNSGWMPVRVAINFSGASSRVYEITWINLRKGEASSWFPQNIVMSWFNASERRPNAQLILMQKQTLAIKPDSIVLGAAVANMDFTLTPPDHPKIFDTSDPSKLPQPNNKSPKAALDRDVPSLIAFQRAFFSPMVLTGLGIVLAVSLVATLRIRSSSKSRAEL